MHATRERALALANRAIEGAERGEPTSVEIELPARPVLGVLMDAGVLRRALVWLERDGTHARIAVRPRRRGGATKIAELFEEDHRRMDELAHEMRSVAHQDPMRAVVLANLLVWGLRRHIRIEEEIVFPLYAARTQYALTSAKMRVEHAAIATYVDRIERNAAALCGDARRDVAIAHLLDAEAGLSAVLAEHNMKEEQTFFPLLDHTTKTVDRERVLRQIVVF